MFKALILEQDDQQTLASIQQLEDSRLPDQDVEIAVDYSSLNYKDGLAITGTGKIIREFPMVPGIDLAGTVLSSRDERYKAGDQVVLTGHGVGENHWGGLAEKARLKGDWLVPLPAGLDGKQAMQIGTAGLTAMLCVMALEDAGIAPDQGEILVTGASGGVGSVAVTLLHALGYAAVAVTGREENAPLLKELGASRVVLREEMLSKNRPLDKQLWAGAIDSVGSHILAKALSQTNYGGAVAACGLAGGFDLPTTVMPFILRGVRLLGVDSVYCPTDRRTAAWQRLAETLPAHYYQQACEQISLAQTPEYAARIVKGQITGRVVVKP